MICATITFELIPKARTGAGRRVRSSNMKGAARPLRGGAPAADRDGVKQSVECKNEIESSVEPQMLPILQETCAAAARTVPLAVMCAVTADDRRLCRQP